MLAGWLFELIRRSMAQHTCSMLKFLLIRKSPAHNATGFSGEGSATLPANNGVAVASNAGVLNGADREFDRLGRLAAP